MTVTSPVFAPVGIVQAIEVLLQEVIAASVPAKSTVLVVLLTPKPVPVIVNASPEWPEAEEKVVMAGSPT